MGNDHAVLLVSDQVMESFTDERTLIVNGKPVEDGDHQPVMDPGKAKNEKKDT